MELWNDGILVFKMILAILILSSIPSVAGPLIQDCIIPEPIIPLFQHSNIPVPIQFAFVLMVTTVCFVEGLFSVIGGSKEDV
jgi:hypothetical protein